MRRHHQDARRDSIALSLSERERKAGHEDHLERGGVLADIDWESDRRGWSQAQLHDACGLPDGRLRDGSQSTETLHAALRHVTGLPR